MSLIKFIKSLFNKPKFVMKENIFPFNTIIDNRYLLENNIGLEYSSQAEAKRDIFNKIESFYRGNRNVMVIRHFYYDHALVVVRPESFDNGTLTLQAVEGLSASIFIGKHGQDIEHFKNRLNDRIYERYGFYNPVKTINIKIVGDKQ